MGEKKTHERENRESPEEEQVHNEASEDERQVE